MSNGQLSLPRERATEGFERSRKDNSIFLTPRHFRLLFTEKERGRFTEEVTCKSGILCRNEKGSICKKKIKCEGVGVVPLYLVCLKKKFKNIFYINSQDINAKSILLV